MTPKPRHQKHEADYLHRARLALRVLSGSGLGELTWVGPKWICALGDVDRRGLAFLSMRIRQDSRLRRDVRQCNSGSDLRNLQEAAISRVLQEYAMIRDNQGQDRTDVNQDPSAPQSALSSRH